MASAVYPVSEADISRYEENGVICLRGVLGPEWIDQLRRALEDILASPGPQGRADESKGGRFSYDTFMWTRNETFWRLQAESPIPAISAKLMRSRVSHLMADVLFAKEPNTPNRESPECRDAWASAHRRTAWSTWFLSGHLRTDEDKDLTGKLHRLFALDRTVMLEGSTLGMTVGG